MKNLMFADMAIVCDKSDKTKTIALLKDVELEKSQSKKGYWNVSIGFIKFTPWYVPDKSFESPLLIMGQFRSLNIPEIIVREIICSFPAFPLGTEDRGVWHKLDIPKGRAYLH